MADPQFADHQWDYKCPQFCDFTAPESEDQLRQNDYFFEVDHENTEINGTGIGGDLSPPTETPVVGKVFDGVALGLEDDGFTYQTPPQNKENVEEDNEVFYSSKKYLSIEKSYKLRSTPMRVLQYNGNTPLRETRLSSKKKRKGKKAMTESVTLEESEEVFVMNELIETLPLLETSKPIESEPIDGPKEEPVIDDIGANPSDTKQSGEATDQLCEAAETDKLLQPPEVPQVVDRRLSYVIENRSEKTVKVVSPPKTGSTRKRSMATSRRKATPLRRSVAKVNAASVVSRLYSTGKKPEKTYKSLAEILKEFETQPRGGRSASADRTGGMQRSRSSSLSSLTCPKSPKLHSIHRHRPTPRQTEDIIASQIKKYSFKANPIRKKLFDAKFASGIPRVKSNREPTKAVEMHFLTEKRHEMRATKQSNGDNSQDKPQLPFRANPMPDFNKPLPQIQKNVTAKKPTVFRPFSFDQRTKELMAKKRSLSVDSHPQTRNIKS